MRNFNHTRPQLRLLDNMRRELGRMPDSPTRPGADENWPPHLRPIAARKDTLLAFSELFSQIDAWLMSDGANSSSDFPADLQRAAHAFAEVRVQRDYDFQYRGKDWIADLEKSENEQARAWGSLLAIFVYPQRDQS